jgi:hypothetical protein
LRKFQRRSQEKYVRNVPGTEMKIVYTQKNKSHIVDRTNAGVNVKKLVKCKPSKSQTWKRQVLLRINSSSDSEAEMIAYLRDGNAET